MFSLAVSWGGEDELHFREGSRKIRDTSGTQGDTEEHQTQAQHKDVKAPISGSKNHPAGQGGLFGP